MDIILGAVEVLSRWGHHLFGIVWIGLLYYFNFVQGAFLAGASKATKVEVFTGLMPRALSWYRYGALFTFLTGLVLLLLLLRGGGLASLPVDLMVWSVMVTVMFLNVWLIIWPRQAVVIRSHESVRDGGEADPGAADAAAKAFLASRTNVLLAAPMLALMTTNTHSPLGAPHTHGGGEPHIGTLSLTVLSRRRGAHRGQRPLGSPGARARQRARGHRVERGARVCPLRDRGLRVVAVDWSTSGRMRPLKGWDSPNLR